MFSRWTRNERDMLHHVHFDIGRAQHGEIGAQLAGQNIDHLLGYTSDDMFDKEKAPDIFTDNYFERHNVDKDKFLTKLSLSTDRQIAKLKKEVNKRVLQEILI